MLRAPGIHARYGLRGSLADHYFEIIFKEMMGLLKIISDLFFSSDDCDTNDIHIYIKKYLVYRERKCVTGFLKATLFKRR